MLYDKAKENNIKNRPIKMGKLFLKEDMSKEMINLYRHTVLFVYKTMQTRLF
jgi:hypothetical protein